MKDDLRRYNHNICSFRSVNIKMKHRYLAAGWCGGKLAAFVTHTLCMNLFLIGCAGIIVGHPPDTVKACCTSYLDQIQIYMYIYMHPQSRLQTQGIAGTAVRYRSTFHCLSDVIKTEGGNIINGPLRQLLYILL